MSGYIVVVGGSARARARWTSRQTYKTKRGAQKAAMRIHAARHPGVATVWVLKANPWVRRGVRYRWHGKKRAPIATSYTLATFARTGRRPTAAQRRRLGRDSAIRRLAEHAVQARVLGRSSFKYARAAQRMGEIAAFREQFDRYRKEFASRGATFKANPHPGGRLRKVMRGYRRGSLAFPEHPAGLFPLSGRHMWPYGQIYGYARLKPGHAKRAGLRRRKNKRSRR